MKDIYDLGLLKAIANPEGNIFISFGLQRSGQHAIINWICNNFKSMIHLNNCTFQEKQIKNRLLPKTNRCVFYRGESTEDTGMLNIAELKNRIGNNVFEKALYSLEDFDIRNFKVFDSISKKYEPTYILIVRDTYNWLASSMRHGRSSKEELLHKVDIQKSKIEIAIDKGVIDKSRFIIINYNQFVTSLSYRKEIANSVGFKLVQKAEDSLSIVPKFGGGSSFSNQKDGEKIQKQVFDRWKEYMDDEFYRSVIGDRDLELLTEKLFGTFINLDDKKN